MPLYEYRCQGCGHVSTELRPASKRDEPLVCPHCGGVAKVIFSTFATAVAESGSECDRRSSCEHGST